MDKQQQEHKLKDFIWDLKYSQLKEQVEALKNVYTTAKSIGLEKTTEFLLPVLQALICQSDDVNCLKLLLDQLTKLAPFLSGSHCVHQLLPSFDNLLKREDETIQNAAIDCLRLYSKDVNSSSLELNFKPHLHRLTTDNCVATRRIVCRLYSAYYPRLSLSLKEELLHDYGTLCRDAAACVRQAAAFTLGEFCKVVDFERIRSVIIPLFISLTLDEKDVVRMASIEAFLGICGKLIPRNVESLLLPVIMKLVDDNDYTVKLQIAKSIIDLQRALGPSMSKSYLIRVFSTYYNDPITDIRTAIIYKTCEFCSNLESSVRESFLINSIFPHLESLCCDPSQEVRLAVCDLLKLAQLLSLERIKSHLTPTTLALLRDENAAVAYRALCNLKYVKRTVDIYVLSNSLNAEMMVAFKLNKKDKLLRLIDSVPLYAAGLGEEFIDDKLVDNILLTELNHTSALIKTSISNAMRRTVGILGLNWCQRTLLPQLTSILEKNTFTANQLCFNWAHVILLGLPSAIVSNKVLAFLEQLKDRIIDQKELRHIVFKAIKEEKNNIDNELLKETIATLEKGLFKDPTDREYLQLALSETDKAVDEKEVLVQGENGHVEAVERRVKNRINGNHLMPDDGTNFRKRISLPPTLLFQEGTNLDFTQSLNNSSRYSALFANSELQSKTRSRINSWTVTTNKLLESKDLPPTELQLENQMKEDKVESQHALVTVTENRLEIKKTEENESDENEPFEVIGEDEIKVQETIFHVTKVVETVLEVPKIEETQVEERQFEIPNVVVTNFELPIVEETKVPKIEETQFETPKIEETQFEVPKIEETEVEELKVEETQFEVIKIEKTQFEVPKIEETQFEVPKIEEPQFEELKVEETQVELPKIEETQFEVPKIEEAQLEELKVEETQVEELKIEATQVEVLKIEETQYELPKIEETQFEVPKIEETQFEVPKIEKTHVEVPKIEETQFEVPKIEETQFEVPKIEETQFEVPKIEETQFETQKIDQTQFETLKIEETHVEGPQDVVARLEEIKFEENGLNVEEASTVESTHQDELYEEIIDTVSEADLANEYANQSIIDEVLVLDGDELLKENVDVVDEIFDIAGEIVKDDSPKGEEAFLIQEEFNTNAGIDDVVEEVLVIDEEVESLSDSDESYSEDSIEGSESLNVEDELFHDAEDAMESENKTITNAVVNEANDKAELIRQLIDLSDDELDV